MILLCPSVYEYGSVCNFDEWTDNTDVIKPRNKVFFLPIHAGYLLGLFLDPEYTSSVPLKHRLTFAGLHGDTARKIVSSVKFYL
jgi:hypothetical protein